MASQFDDSDFVDRDYQNSENGYATGGPRLGGNSTGVASRPPTRQELESRVSQAQQKLAELRRAQEELERERAALEDARRRRSEFQTGREEVLQSLTRGVTLLEQAEFAARRDAEQMSKTLSGLREALLQIQTIQEDSWNQENWNVELTRALAAIENARLEWNSARLKWTLLNGVAPEGHPETEATPLELPWGHASFWQLCRIGFALTWPVATVGLLALALLLVLRLR